MKLEEIKDMFENFLKSVCDQLNVTEYIGEIKISTEDIQKVLEIIERQKPKDVICRRAPHDYPFSTGLCPMCLYSLDERDLYCRLCGQHVSWRKEFKNGL